MCNFQKIVIFICFAIVESKLCNQLGTALTIQGMDHEFPNGTCLCHSQHVIGEYCNACAPGYYGLWTGSGCLPCDRHCNAEGTLKIRTNLLQCDTLGRCLCQEGYYGARCEEKPEVACEDCKPNCYKIKNKCEKCNACYNLVQEKFDKYPNAKNNTLVVQQKHYRDLEKKIEAILIEIVEPPNVILDDKLIKYYKEMNSIKTQLRDLVDNNNLSKLEYDLVKKLELFDKAFSEINNTQDVFRQNLDNLATSTENSNLAKIIKEILNARDKVVNHVKDIQKIAKQTNQTCLETGKQYDEFERSFKQNQNILKKMEEKLLDWETIKNTSTQLLRKFNSMCNEINTIKGTQYETGHSENYTIQDLDEKLQLYQEADKLLHGIKDIKLDGMLKAKVQLEKTLGDFDDFIREKEKQLKDLKALLKHLQQINNFGRIEERLEQINRNIKNYLEKNKKLLASMKILLKLAITDDELEEIEREIDFLTQEFEYIIEISLNLQNRLIKAKNKLDEEFSKFQVTTRQYEKQWKQDEKIYLDVIVIYDFILKEIANKNSLDAIEQELDEAYELLEIAYEKIRLDIDLNYLNNVKAELEKLTVTASEICGTAIGDSD